MTTPPPHPLRPSVKRVLGALVLGGGVFAIGTLAMPATPREFEARIDLHSWREGRLRAQSITVRLARNGEVLRAWNEQFGFEGPPTTWTRMLTAAPGAYRVTVHLECELGAREANTDITVRAGEPLVLAAPRPE